MTFAGSSQQGSEVNFYGLGPFGSLCGRIRQRWRRRLRCGVSPTTGRAARWRGLWRILGLLRARRKLAQNTARWLAVAADRASAGRALAGGKNLGFRFCFDFLGCQPQSVIRGRWIDGGCDALSNGYGGCGAARGVRIRGIRFIGCIGGCDEHIARGAVIDCKRNWLDRAAAGRAQGSRGRCWEHDGRLCMHRFVWLGL